MAKTVIPVIRERRPADLERCVRALRRVHEHDAYPVNWPRDPVHWLAPADLAGAWIAERVGQQVLGHVALRRGEQAEALQLSRLFVTPDAHGLGLGAALIETAGAFAAGQGCGLELEVVADERSHAIALYERTGWRRVGTATAEWTSPDGACIEVHRYVRARSLR